MHPLSLLALSALTTMLAACGGGSGGGAGAGTGGGTSNPCGETARKQWVLNVAREWYLFPDLLPASTDIATYPTAEELLDALTATARAQGKDRFFSYLTTKSAEDSLSVRASSSASVSAHAPTPAIGHSFSTCSKAALQRTRACSAATR